MALVYDENGNVIGDDGTGSEASISSGELAALGVEQNVTASNVGYFTQKANEFQQMLYDVDATAAIFRDMLDNYDLTESSIAEIQQRLSEYDSRKTALKFAAEAFNAVASMVNSVGGSLPNINIPMTLGFAPLAIPVAAAAAIAGAAILVSWGIGWMAASRNTVSSIAAQITDPVLRDKVLANAANMQAREEASGGTLGTLANIAKWIAIGGAVFVAYRFYVSSQSKG